jgi:hypothetical protein
MQIPGSLPLEESQQNVNPPDAFAANSFKSDRLLQTELYSFHNY